jgi:hypothetical protein
VVCSLRKVPDSCPRPGVPLSRRLSTLFVRSQISRMAYVSADKTSFFHLKRSCSQATISPPLNDPFSWRQQSSLPDPPILLLIRALPPAYPLRLALLPGMANGSRSSRRQA